MSDTTNETPATTAVNLMTLILNKMRNEPKEEADLFELYKKCRTATKYSLDK